MVLPPLCASTPHANNPSIHDTYSINYTRGTAAGQRSQSYQYPVYHHTARSSPYYLGFRRLSPMSSYIYSRFGVVRANLITQRNWFSNERPPHLPSGALINHMKTAPHVAFYTNPQSVPIHFLERSSVSSQSSHRFAKYSRLAFVP